MRTLEPVGHSVGLTIEDGSRAVWHEDNCPAPLQGNIQKALSKGPTSGTIAAADRLWQWHALLAPTVTIELTRDDVVVQSIVIPATGWAAFQLCADRRGIDARSWLTFFLADGLWRVVRIEEILRWLFPSKSAPEIQRFDSMRQEFHAMEVARGITNICAG